MSKFLKLSFLFALIISLASCSSDDDSSSSSSSDLVGTWAMVSFETNSTVTTEFQGQTLTSSIESMSTDNVAYTATFTDSAFTTEGSYGYMYSGTANGVDIPATTAMIENVTGSGTYSVSGNTMTVNGSFFELDFKGTQQTAMAGEQMVNFQIDGNQLTFSQNEVVESTTSGITAISDVMSTSVWVRQ